MDRPDIIPGIKEKLPDFQPISVTEDHPDEVRIGVNAGDFKYACLALHEILSCPVMMLFASDERAKTGKFRITCVFTEVKKGRWIIVNADIPGGEPYFDSMAKEMHSASLFEREMWEMFGVEPKGNPDLRRLNLHDEIWPSGNYPLRKDFNGPIGGETGEYKFGRVEGEGVFEVPVGPVHAGIIGPGHFRFSVAGEPIINLEIRLGFTHRGVEKLFEGKYCHEAVRLSECVSGDSAFAHSLAFTRAAEKISGAPVAGDAVYLRAIFLELERMYNHVNDIGGMAVDVGFSFPSAYASVIKEAILRLNGKLTGSRYLKGVNGTGGISAALDESNRKALIETVAKVKKDFDELVKILNSSVSFMDRVDTTGVLRKKTAEDMGVLGLVGRSSGIPMDLRKYFSAEYNDAKFKMAVQGSGDVLARLRVRISEFEESCRLIGEFAGKVKGVQGSVLNVRPAEGSALGYAEGWRGPVLYWVKTGPSGSIERCKIVDPSFLNWQGLSYAVLGNIIPDFPLCNKSFDLSYSGKDL